VTRLFDDALIARYRAAGWWASEPLATAIRKRAHDHPAGPAFVEDDRVLSWRAYHEQSTRLARLLAAAGLAAGDPLAVLLPSGIDVHVVYAAAEEAGLVVVGISPRSRANEIRHILEMTGCDTLVTEQIYRDRPATSLVEELHALGCALGRHLILQRDGGDLALHEADGREIGAPSELPPLRALGPDELWFISSTSGTTGLPKCVMQTQNRYRFFHGLAVEAGDLTGDDVFASFVPPPFGFGLWTQHVTPTLLGAPTVLLRDFEPGRALAAVARTRATVLCVVSTQLVMLLNSPDFDRHDLGSLRVVFTGGERVPYARALELEERTGCSVLQFYGSTEAIAVSRTTTSDPLERRLGTAGRIVDAMNVRVLDRQTGDDLRGSGRAGICVCSGPAASPGYFRDDAANERLFTTQGEIRLPDLVTIDAEGYLTVVGRDSDIVIRGGQNVSAAVIEELVAEHPRVAAVGVVGAPDDVYGERICAFVATRDGRPLELAELCAFLDGRQVSKYMWPERVMVVDELPLSVGGKLDKVVLREWAARS
jgi:acyl-CoA synthetase